MLSGLLQDPGDPDERDRCASRTRWRLTHTGARDGLKRPTLSSGRMDLVADELGVDPVEVRRKNFPTPDEFPFKTATGLFYDSGNYQAALDRALEMADYQSLREEQKKAREQGRLDRHRRFNLR